MTQTLRFTALLLVAYARDRSALFFALVLPLMLMIIFGSLNFGAFVRIELGVVDEAANADSRRFVAALSEVRTLRVIPTEREALERSLRRSELDLAVVIPRDFRLAPARPGSEVPTLRLYVNEAAPQEAGVGRAILAEVVDRISLAASNAAPVVRLEEQAVSGVRLRYVDFLVPGIVGMNVMQIGVLSVAFGLVAWKQHGVLRRILATPLRPVRFLAAHGLMRVVLNGVQVVVLLLVAFVLFQVRIVGSLADLFVVALLGALPFLMQGFALAGWATTDNQVAPLANLITLPQFFLSGVFFPKEAAPDVIEPFTAWLPLTLLNDALREIGTQGGGLWDVRVQIAGLLVWSVVGFVLAVRLLRLESS